MYYDKAKNLNGYNLWASQWVKPIYRQKFEANNSSNFYDERSFEIWFDVISYLNASVTVKYFRELNDSNQEVIFGEADFSMVRTFIRDYWALQVYPIDSTCLKVLTLKESEDNYERAANSFSLKNIMFLIMILMVSIATLKWILPRQSISDVAMESIRIWTCSAVTKLPKNSSMLRIIFMLFSVAFMNFASYIQSKISANNIVPNQTIIDSFDDLKFSNLTIYGLEHHRKLLPFDKRSFQHYTNVKEAEECIRLLISGHRVACLHSTRDVCHRKKERRQIHISESFAERSITYTTSKYQRLRYKFNYAFRKLNEAGCVKLKDLRKFHIRKIMFGDLLTEGDEVIEKSMDVEMIVGLVFFLAGLIFSVFSFIFEFIFFKFLKSWVPDFISKQKKFLVSIRNRNFLFNQKNHLHKKRRNV